MGLIQPTISVECPQCGRWFDSSLKPPEGTTEAITDEEWEARFKRKYEFDVIRTVFHLSDRSLQQAKELVDQLPQRLKTSLPKVDAVLFQQNLEAASGVVSLPEAGRTRPLFAGRQKVYEQVGAWEQTCA